MPYCQFLEGFNSLSIRTNTSSAGLRPKIQVSVKGVNPYVIYDDPDDLRGADLDILRALGDKLGFDYDLKEEVTWMTTNDQGEIDGGTVGSVRKNLKYHMLIVFKNIHL